MKLRTQSLLFLFLFGFSPLIVALAINLPLVFDQLQLFYHKAHLQNLRADFRDLDEHLASRREMVRLLAKLPEPGLIIQADETKNGISIDAARTRYGNWINQLMYDQPDVIDIIFLDRTGKPQFWLERDHPAAEFRQVSSIPDLPRHEQIESVMRLQPRGVLTSPIHINPTTGQSDPTRYMMLRLISPIYFPHLPGKRSNSTEPLLGAIVINIDVGGLARVYRNTYWVHDDGKYLRHTRYADEGTAAAFEDFPGLAAIFAKRELALWEGNYGKQVIWVPLFATEHSGPLWVGREVDPSPITSFRRALQLRVAFVVLALIVAILFIARWFALRVERFGRELTDGIGKVLERAEPVKFSWKGPQELRTISRHLTQLAETHAQNNRAMRAHAKALEESNRYKSEFLANVSHELRTPLNSILLLSKLLAHDKQGVIPSEQVKQAQIINKAGNDLMALIDNILDLSRIEARKSTLRVEPVDLPALLDEVQTLFLPQFNEKGLSLEIKIDDDAPKMISSDREKLSQIVKNFLSNAVKFTHQGGVVVHLVRNDGEQSDKYPVRLNVTDSGIGIPRDKLGFVFEAFEQVDGSTSRRYGGTGLGLTISRELTTLLGGSIEVESTEGTGSTFTLLLPIDFDHALVDESKSVSGPLITTELSEEDHFPEPDFGGGNILLVDDDLPNLLALTPVLERWNLIVTAAGDGEEALETLDAEEDFDLVFVDVMMPGMDGYETIHHIRAKQRFKELPIIALTAIGDPNERQRCHRAGANDLITKPVDTTELSTLIGRYLSSAVVNHTPN